MRTRALTALAIALLSGLLYATRLDVSPIYMMHDETQFALQAQSVATTGHDLGGRLLPVFFSEPEFPAGRDPVIIYVSALVLRLLPLSEGSARLATALVGVLNIVLAFLVARRLFKSTYAGVAGAVLLAFTPAHFIRARLALSPLYSVPFVLLWLLALIAFEDTPSVRRLAAAGAWLGLGVYTYLASVIMMPLYLALTCLWLLRSLDVRGVTIAIAAFVAVLLPMLAWYGFHPERFSQIFGSYHEFSTTTTLPLLDSIRARVAMYWSFFNPEFLFMSGDTSLINSTRQVGFFPMAFAVLIPCGLYTMWKSGRPILWIIGIGFLTAPLASIVSGAIEMNRIMYAIPFGALAATVGLMALANRSGWTRVAALLLVVSVAWQFAVFHADYFGAYRARSAPWLGGNLRDAMLPVIRVEPSIQATPVYISARIPFASRYWRFNAVRLGRDEVIGRAVYYTEPPADAPPGSALICPSADADCAKLSASGAWERTAVAREPDQTPSYDVLYRRQPRR